MRLGDRRFSILLIGLVTCFAAHCGIPAVARTAWRARTRGFARHPVRRRWANDRTRKLFNAAVFERHDMKGGRLCHKQCRPPFDGVFTVSEFQYGTPVEVAGIEPASFSTSPGLLRVQPAAFFSAPAVTQASRRRAQPLCVVLGDPAAGPPS